jgi:hypothetical protein
VAALDALRNLYVQACIINRPHLAKHVLQCGLLQTVERIISVSIQAA